MSTNNSAATGPLVREPSVFEGGEESVVLPRYVEVALPTVLHSRDPDDLEGRMVLRIEQLPLQSLQTAAEHVGLGGVQLRSQTLEPLLLGGIQINLRGLPYTSQARRLKELERENGRLKRAVADLTLDKLILEEAAEGNF